MSNFFTPEFNNESAIAPWNASLEPTKGIIPQLDANRVLTGGVGQEVNMPTLTPEAYDNIIFPDASLTRMASVVNTESNTSLPDSSVDLLTGQAMSEVYGDLSKFAADPDFAAKLNVPFGENWDAAAAKTLAEAWFKGDFSDIPQVKVVSSAEIGGANGAFAAATDTIYLSKEFLAGNAANPAANADVLLEEIGHSVDARLNVTDSPGDEGAIFGAIVQGKELSEGELQGLKSKDDSATVLFNGQTISIEKADDYYDQNWGGEIFDWSSGTQSSKGFYQFTRNDGNAISSRNAISRNWGDGSPSNVVGSNYFGVNFYTKADFEAGKTYEFSVKADDSYRIGALPINGNQWVNISGQNWKWLNDAYGGKKYSFTPGTTGKYWVYAGYGEKDGAASFSLSWDKVNGSSYISGLSSLTDDQWDRQSGDGNQFNDNNRDSGRITEIDESLPDVKQVSKDLSTALFGKILSLNTGYAYDYTNGSPGGDPYNGSTKAHAGIDYGAGVGQEVSAIVGGKVKKVTDYGSIGKFVTVESFDGRRWIYGHIQNSKQENQDVSQGEKIGTVVYQVDNQGKDNTHFHLEVDSPPFNDSIIGGINRLNRDQSNLSFVRQNTMSPLQAYWKYRNNIKE